VSAVGVSTVEEKYLLLFRRPSRSLSRVAPLNGQTHFCRPRFLRIAVLYGWEGRMTLLRLLHPWADLKVQIAHPPSKNERARQAHILWTQDVTVGVFSSQGGMSRQ